MRSSRGLDKWTKEPLPHPLPQESGLPGCAAQVATGMNLMDLDDLGESFHIPVLFVGLRLLE